MRLFWFSRRFWNRWRCCLFCFCNFILYILHCFFKCYISGIPGSSIYIPATSLCVFKYFIQIYSFRSLSSHFILKAIYESAHKHLNKFRISSIAFGITCSPASIDIRGFLHPETEYIFGPFIYSLNQFFNNSVSEFLPLSSGSDYSS